MILQEVDKISISSEEVLSIYAECKKIYDKNLKKHGIDFPELKKKDGTFVSKALQLVCLYKYKGQVIHKDKIANWIKEYIPGISNDVQVRHLSSQNGFNSLNSKDKIPGTNKMVPIGCHILLDLENPSPSFNINKRKTNLTEEEWKTIKRYNHNKCTSCGAVEGQSHPEFPNKITELQKGHKDPTKGIDADNVIPQCQVCNRSSKDMFVFDARDKVIAIGKGGVKLVTSADSSVKKEISNQLEVSGFGSGLLEALSSSMISDSFKLALVEKIIKEMKNNKEQLSYIQGVIDSLKKDDGNV